MDVLRETGRRGGARLGRGLRRRDTDDPEAFARASRPTPGRHGLDCSVGIGQNKLQAKIATGYGKPPGCSG